MERTIAAAIAVWFIAIGAALIHFGTID